MNVLHDLFERMQCDEESRKQIREQAGILCAELCRVDEGKSKKVTMHTMAKIYPCIAFYKTYSAVTGDAEQAYAIVEKYFADRCVVMERKLQKLCGIPGVYRLVPRLMAGVIHKIFGTKSGFEMTDQETTWKSCHIDMRVCPYFAKCKENQCPELTTAFCNSDDITYGHLHPKLSWERTQTLGRGDDCCNFIMRIKRHNS